MTRIINLPDVCFLLPGYREKGVAPEVPILIGQNTNDSAIATSYERVALCVIELELCSKQDKPI